MLLLLPVLAGAAWAAADAVPAGRSRIDRALPVDHAVAPVAPLARVEALRPELPQWPMLGPGASAAPVRPDCPGAHPLEAPPGLLGLLLPAWLPLRVAAGAVEGGTPAYGPLRGAAPAAADPFLGPFEVWSHGPLGDVRRQGLAALAAGDGELAREIVERYWRLMETALERRRRHAGGEGIRMLEGRE